MKIPELKGCGTALVTPFLEDGEVDYEAYAALVARQIEGGADFLVPLATLAVHLQMHCKGTTFAVGVGGLWRDRGEKS